MECVIVVMAPTKMTVLYLTAATVVWTLLSNFASFVDVSYLWYLPALPIFVNPRGHGV